MVILAPVNGARKLLPPDAPAPIQLTQAQIIKRNADAMKRAKAASWTRAANAQAARFAPKNGTAGATAGGAGKNTTPTRPAAIAKPAAFFPPALPPPALPPPPPTIPPPIAKVPKLPPLPPLPPPPLPPPSLPPATSPVGVPGTAAGGGGAGGGIGIMLMLGMALLASFGKR